MTRQQVRRWVAAAALDGWDWTPTYKHESIETAVTLTKRGFKVMAIMRHDKDANISIWGADELAVTVPETYDWQALQVSVSVCSYCKAQGVMVRIGFAGRCCAPCREKHKATAEHPGWCN